MGYFFIAFVRVSCYYLKMKSNIQEVILNVLIDHSDGSVNLQDYHNQVMIAEKIENAVLKHIREEISETIEEIVCGEPSENCGESSEDCCGGECHE